MIYTTKIAHSITHPYAPALVQQLANSINLQANFAEDTALHNGNTPHSYRLRFGSRTISQALFPYSVRPTPRIPLRQALLANRCIISGYRIDITFALRISAQSRCHLSRS